MNERRSLRERFSRWWHNSDKYENYLEQLWNIPHVGQRYNPFYFLRQVEIGKAFGAPNSTEYNNVLLAMQPNPRTEKLDLQTLINNCETYLSKYRGDFKFTKEGQDRMVLVEFIKKKAQREQEEQAQQPEPESAALVLRGVCSGLVKNIHSSARIYLEFIKDEKYSDAAAKAEEILNITVSALYSEEILDRGDVILITAALQSAQSYAEGNGIYTPTYGRSYTLGDIVNKFNYAIDKLCEIGGISAEKYKLSMSNA